MQNPPIEIPERYEPTGTVFTGAQGDVFLCRDTNLNRDVAIKFARDTTNPATLLGEVRALASIQSKHVIRLYDVIDSPDSNIIGLIVEFLPGDDLSQYCARDVRELLLIMYQIACGLSDIHAAQTIHRDVKPKNMKFGDDGILKLFDFGLSCQTDDAETEVARGTRVYRGPEYYNPPPITLTDAADTYAFGVTVWWLVANSFPWQLRDTPPKRPDSFATHALPLPARIVDLLDRTFDPDPDKRPSIVAIRDEIARQLLFGQHRARFSDGTRSVEVTEVGKAVRVSLNQECSAVILYDGLEFRLSAVIGDVFLNGVAATAGDLLPDSCVLILGDASMEYNRKFVTFDVSHPEVVL